MRFSLTPAHALACATVFALAACSGSTSTEPANPASALGSTTLAPLGKALTPPKRLAAALFNSVVVLDSSYNVVQTITDGVSVSDGVAFDPTGNLYVSNDTGPSVTEYNKKGDLIFTYSADLIHPQGVTVDKSGNVYVPNSDDATPSDVVEYSQGSNTPVASCSTGMVNQGLAIDSKGDVFVAGEVASDLKGEILEYTGGLSGCNGTELDLSVSDGIFGLLFDKHDNLIACDATNDAVDIIPPPYTKVRKTLTGFAAARSAALNKDQSLIYVTNDNPYALGIVVDKYPSGQNVTTLTNGITYAILGVGTYR
jgi:hypothetical protein